MALTNDVQLIIKPTLTGTAGMSAVTATVTEIITSNLDTVACDLLYSVSGTGTTTYVLNDGSITDPLGTALTFVKVMLLFVRNTSDTAFTFGAVANGIDIINGDTDAIALAPNAQFLYIDETGITLGNEDSIKLTGTAGKTFDLMVIGSSS